MLGFFYIEKTELKSVLILIMKTKLDLFCFFEGKLHLNFSILFFLVFMLESKLCCKIHFASHPQQHQ